MYQKRKIRAEKKNNDSQESFSKVSISWDSGAYRKLPVTIGISDFQKSTSCIF